VFCYYYDEASPLQLQCIAAAPIRLVPARLALLPPPHPPVVLVKTQFVENVFKKNTVCRKCVLKKHILSKMCFYKHDHEREDARGGGERIAVRSDP